MVLMFRGVYGFLSNMHLVIIDYEGLSYTCVEAAFQAAKCIDIKQRQQFVPLDGRSAKRIGKTVKIRPDWNEVREQIMLDLLRIKFSEPQH